MIALRHATGYSCAKLEFERMDAEPWIGLRAILAGADPEEVILGDFDFLKGGNVRSVVFEAPLLGEEM